MKKYVIKRSAPVRVGLIVLGGAGMIVASSIYMAHASPRSGAVLTALLIGYLSGALVGLAQSTPWRT